MIARVGRMRASRVLGLWVIAVAVLSIYTPLRARVDDAGLPVHGHERVLFSTLPSSWSQQHLVSIAPHAAGWTILLVHVSWFLVPWGAAAYVSLRRPERIGSFFKSWLVLCALALALFALFPTQPPWMADPHVQRIIAQQLGKEIHDSNPLAALPSMHVALPLIAALWFARERWRPPAVIMALYTLCVAVEVVVSGEHYVIDVAAAALCAVAAMGIAADTPALAPATAVSRLKRLAVGNSRGQSLIEFALVAPLVLMFLWVIVDFGIALDRRIVLQHAVREGAREAAVKVDPALAKQMVVSQSQGLIQTGQVDICFVDLNGDGIANALEPIKVSTSYTYKFSMPFGKLATAWGASWSDIVLDPSATAALENDPIGPVFTECPP